MSEKKEAALNRSPRIQDLSRMLIGKAAAIVAGEANNLLLALALPPVSRHSLIGARPPPRERAATTVRRWLRVVGRRVVAPVSRRSRLWRAAATTWRPRDRVVATCRMGDLGGS